MCGSVLQARVSSTHLSKDLIDPPMAVDQLHVVEGIADNYNFEMRFGAGWDAVVFAEKKVMILYVTEGGWCALALARKEVCLVRHHIAAQKSRSNGDVPNLSLIISRCDGEKAVDNYKGRECSSNVEHGSLSERKANTERAAK
jgi:hypothetical protein